MGERRDHTARLNYLIEIKLSGNHSNFRAAIRDHLTPGIDDQRMAVTFPAVLMIPALRGRHDESAGFDRP